MNYPEEGYRDMIGSFRFHELQALLEDFCPIKSGRKSELKECALEILRNKPVGINYQAFLVKIAEIYQDLQNDASTNNDILTNMIMHNQRQQMSIGVQQAQPPRTYQQQSQYPRQPSLISRPGLPQVMPQIQRGVYGNSSRGNNIQYTYQPACPRNTVSQVPLNQQVNAAANQHMTHDKNNANSLTSSVQSLANVKLQVLPFFKNVAVIIKPTTLVGHERCLVSNTPQGLREERFNFKLTPEQATLITMNRDISDGKNEYIYQLQLRICILNSDSTEITDYLPLGLHVRLNNKFCPLPPTGPNTRPGTEARRTARPIDITLFVKFNPCISNLIIVNWIPDEKTYVMVLNLIKKLTAPKLLQKLKDKGPRSSAYTKNHIIEKLAQVDPDVATTTSYHFSLLCPLGGIRMKIPAKSTKCVHYQCFDASTYILMNENKPTWMCPSCGKPCLYDDLVIEDYFVEVLSSPDLPDDCKKIELLADGTWKAYKENKEPIEIDIDKDKPMDSVNLDSDDENSMVVIKADNPHPGISKESEKLNSFVDLSLGYENCLREKSEQQNEAQAADDVQPVPSVHLKPLTLVQPLQAVTSSEQGVVIDLDSSPSPPTSPTPETTAF